MTTDRIVIYGKFSEIAKFLAWGIINESSGCDVQLLMENVVDGSSGTAYRPETYWTDWVSIGRCNFQQRCKSLKVKCSAPT